MMCCGCALEAQILRQKNQKKEQKVSKYKWSKFLKRQEVKNDGKTKKYPGET